MEFLILSKKESIYSTHRLIEEIKKSGHNVDVKNPRFCYMDINSTRPLVYHRKSEVKHYDALIPRIAASNVFYGTSIIRQFEMMGVTSLNSSLGIARSSDKLRSMQLLSNKKIDIPRTMCSFFPENISKIIDMVGGLPLIVKSVSGTQGIGVMLIESESSVRSVIETFMSIKTNVMVQEYIKEAEGTDIRCFVLGNRVIAAMSRKAVNGDFRSNIHRGGVGGDVSITPLERRIAIKSAKIMGLNMAGVDIIRSKRGPLVLEVNSSPGLQGIERATGKNIAKMIVEFLLKDISSK